MSKIVIANLRPAGNFRRDTSYARRVAALQRPYQMLTEDEYTSLMVGCCDVVTDGTNLFTFGDADGGKALMPIRDRSIVEPIADPATPKE